MLVAPVSTQTRRPWLPNWNREPVTTIETLRFAYTDKRTAISTQKRWLLLDGKDSARLTSSRHDQTNQIRQYPSRRSKPGPGFLHGEARVHHHYGPAVR